MQESESLPQYADSVAFSDYKLQKGDYLYIQIATSDQKLLALFNGETNGATTNNITPDEPTSRLYLYLIGEDGCIDYLYLGKIPAADLTVRELRDKIQEKMSDLAPGVSVDVRLSNRTFSVIGEAGSGRYQIPKEKLTIYEALAISGDLQLSSKRDKVKLIRQTPEGTVVKTFDLRTRSLIDSEYYYIQPNDVIYVPFTNAKYWGASQFTSVLALSFSTISLGFSIYSIIRTIIETSTTK